MGTRSQLGSFVEVESNKLPDVDLPGDFDAQNTDILYSAPTLRIPDAPIAHGLVELWRNAGRTAFFAPNTWGSSGVAAIVSGTRKIVREQLECSSSLDNRESPLYDIRILQNNLRYKSVIRLVEKSLSLFQELELIEAHTLYSGADAWELARNGDVDINKNEHLFNLAEIFRANILQCIQDLGTEGAELVEESKIWHAHCIFFCAQVVYFPDPYTLQPQNLIAWVNRYSTIGMKEIEKVAQAHNSYQHPLFWVLVQRLVLRALFKEAASLLQNSGLIGKDDNHSIVITELCEILISFPVQSQLRIRGRHAYLQQHKLWRVEVTRRAAGVAMYDLEIRSEIEVIYKILSGDQNIIFSLSENWPECLAALNFHAHFEDCLDLQDLAKLLDTVTQSKRGFPIDDSSYYEAACSALLLCDIPKAIQNCYALDPIIATYMAEFCIRAECLENYAPVEFGVSLRDYLLLELGSSCIEIDELLPSSIAFWLAVPKKGLSMISMAVTHVRLKSQVKAEELLEICQELNLKEESIIVASSWARKLELKGDYGLAFYYYDRAQNARLLDSLNWKLFEISLLTSSPLDSLKVDSTLRSYISSPKASSGLIANMIAPLAVLSQFYERLQIEQYKEASESLLNLMKFESMPRKYLCALLCEFLGILMRIKNKSILETSILMDCVSTIEDLRASEGLNDSLEFVQKILDDRRKMVISSGIAEFQYQKKLWDSFLPDGITAKGIIRLLRLEISNATAHNYAKHF